jgi:hypothetical protein
MSALKDWVGREVFGSREGLMALLDRSLRLPRSGFHIFAACPRSFTQAEEHQAAFDLWKRRGKPWRPDEADRRSEYLVAIEELRLRQPAGLAIVYANQRVLCIHAFVVPGDVSLQDNLAITRSIIEEIIAYAKRFQYGLIQCACAENKELRWMLNDHGFHGGTLLEREFAF